MNDLELLIAFCRHISAVEDGWREHVGHIPPNVQAVLDLYRAVAERLDQRGQFPTRELLQLPKDDS